MKLKEKLKLALPKYQKLILDYKVEFKPRYGYGKKPHQLLYDLINTNRPYYKEMIGAILQFKPVFESIKKPESKLMKMSRPGIMDIYPVWT